MIVLSDNLACHVCFDKRHDIKTALIVSFFDLLVQFYYLGLRYDRRHVRYYESPCYRDKCDTISEFRAKTLDY